MLYLITFFEGIITFISPCLLPMIPIYISFFAGSNNEQSKKKSIINSLGFVMGFTIVFVLLGALAGILGEVLLRYNRVINIVCGIIMIVFGLNYIEVFNIKFLNTTKKIGYQPKMKGFLSAVLFGIVFAIGWSPCIGTFLGTALMMAASSTESIKGIVMLICFSLGLGIPFILSAILIDQLKSVFDFINKHSKIVHTIAGILLVIVGVSMLTGHFAKLLSMLSLNF